MHVKLYKHYKMPLNGILFPSSKLHYSASALFEPLKSATSHHSSTAIFGRPHTISALLLLSSNAQGDISDYYAKCFNLTPFQSVNDRTAANAIASLAFSFHLSRFTKAWICKITNWVCLHLSSVLWEAIAQLPVKGCSSVCGGGCPRSPTPFLDACKVYPACKGTYLSNSQGDLSCLPIISS